MMILLQKAILALIPLASLFLTFIENLSVYFKNKVFTVCLSVAVLGAGLSIHIFLGTTYFYIYVGIVFAVGLIFAGLNRISSRVKEKLNDKKHKILGRIADKKRRS